MSLKIKNNVIVFAYSKMSGGKTIINALGLSNDCYLQDYNLVLQQNRGNLCPDQKVELLIDRLRSETLHWFDLHLGDSHLYSRNYTGGQFKKLQQMKNYFFIVVHDIEEFEKLKQEVPDFTCVTLTNTNRFINFRLGFDDPDTDRTQYPNVTQQWSDYARKYFDENADIFWDCDWFFDREHFLSNLENIYKTLGLTDFNEYLVSKYYDEYIVTLKRIILEIKNPPKEINDNSPIRLHTLRPHNNRR